MFDDSGETASRYPDFEANRGGCYRDTVKAGEIIYWQSHWFHSTLVPVSEGPNTTESRRGATGTTGTPSISLVVSFLDDDIITANRCVRDFVFEFADKAEHAERREAAARAKQKAHTGPRTGPRTGVPTGDGRGGCATNCSLCPVPPLPQGRYVHPVNPSDGVW